MRFRSTRSSAEVDFAGALVDGLAPDGGLYTPVETPRLPDCWESWGYIEAVTGVLRAFGCEDPDAIVAEAAAAFSHPEIAPIVAVDDRMVLELFWGPTLSFKDHALQVVARLLAREVSDRTVLVATSGDTGSAAIEACRGRLPIVVLYPEGRVAEMQRRQMTTVDDPMVTVLGVNGTFDDCQAMVKEAFRRRPDLLAVNSINFARVAVQTGYYIHAAARIGRPFQVVVPTGNFGNAYSAWTAARMGAPIERVVVATNANHYLADLFTEGVERRTGVIPTVAPAMDIQVPSNLERLPLGARSDFAAGWASDADIERTIAEVWERHGYMLDPHTAAAWKVASGVGGDVPRLVVGTAHPAKFADVVTRAAGVPPEMPEVLARLADLPEQHRVVEPDVDALLDLIG
ncbi:MAG: threonine synthase [Actinomycetes bacterium]|jgi:threonine synthase|nr:MAG: threonine synthase [Actinomycetota bacterium]